MLSEFVTQCLAQGIDRVVYQLTQLAKDFETQEIHVYVNTVGEIQIVLEHDNQSMEGQVRHQTISAGSLSLDQVLRCLFSPHVQKDILTQAAGCNVIRIVKPTEHIEIRLNHARETTIHSSRVVSAGKDDTQVELNELLVKFARQNLNSSENPRIRRISFESNIATAKRTCLLYN